MNQWTGELKSLSKFLSIACRCETANALLKEVMSATSRTPAICAERLRGLEAMRSFIADDNLSFDDSTVLEIGSGWFPTIPLMLYAQGIKHIYMTDLNVYADDITLDATLRFLREEFPDEPAYDSIRSFDDVPISYLAPFDASAVPDNSLDFIISRTVLEHIPTADIVPLFQELRPKLKPSGRMVHIIDHSDHQQFSDRSISRLHFLRWSERNHAFLYWLMRGGENRLRYHEFPELFAEAGFHVTRSFGEVHDETLQRLLEDPPKLAPRYASMKPEQLAVLTSFYLLEPLQSA